MIRRAASLLASLMLVLPALAAYPEKPITFVVPFSAGGDADLAARNLGVAVQNVLKQPVVIVNKVGASGAIGSQQVKEAAPDGYTLLVARVGSQAVLPALQPSTPYKWNDFTFLALLELNPFVCVVRAESPWKTLDDLARAIRAEPGKLNYSSSGQGTILHLGTQLLLQSLGLPGDAAVHVAYKGGNEAAVAVVSGDVQLGCGNLTSTIGLIKGGKLRALLTTTPERVADIPDVPTAREAGVPQMEAIVGWSALYGPPGMPKELVARWAEVMQRVAADPQWKAGNEKFGGVPRVLSPEETGRFAGEQFGVYQRLARQLGLEQK
jgi:tripartite-type tricarboxylate transporter receptor subunit TctC